MKSLRWAYDLGFEAALRYEPVSVNPFTLDEEKQEWISWSRGHAEAHDGLSYDDNRADLPAIEVTELSPAYAHSFTRPCDWAEESFGMMV